MGSLDASHEFNLYDHRSNGMIQTRSDPDGWVECQSILCNGLGFTRTTSTVLEHRG